MTDLQELAQSGCPWLLWRSAAAFASEAVVEQFASSFPYASPAVRRLFHGRAGYSFCPAILQRTEQATDDTRFLGAVLAKLAHRGLPAPCSLMVERHILREAQEANVLDYQEINTAGEIHFRCQPRLPRFMPLLKVCLIPELLVEESAVPDLLARYRWLCTPAESVLFDRLLSLLPDQRLGLLWLPQRLLHSMGQPSATSRVSSGDRVDFACEVPLLTEDRWLRIALELDDASHTEVQRQQDRIRDQFLRAAHWQVLRLEVREQTQWRASLEMLVRNLSEAIPQEYLDAAQEWRELPVDQKSVKRGTLRLLVCTLSFGMGIDKPNLRFTLHAMLPRSLEEFYQHAGRAGRDKKPARCVLIFSGGPCLWFSIDRLHL